ncbi:restriction endonuclease subunit S [Deinococcus antarcticus]|uniref:Restriction endonuclease subunit S n=1 Tax=Deinococcus antarcticus TaxID=1298767 RepID=A0ABV8AB25_9DEIO
MASEWENLTLAEVCARGGGNIQTGPFGSQLHAEDYVEEGIPSVMPQNIGDNRILEDGIARISPEDANRLSRYLLREGDVVYSRRGDIERRALVRSHENGWLCGTGCLRVRFGEGVVVPEYAAFYLATYEARSWLKNHAVGATMPNLNTAILGALPFVLPPLPIQRQIASILSAFDDKIELNRQMNHTLEQMARALFKSWFVDFDPVRAKMRGEQPEGMDAETAALFPDELVEVNGREVPRGWEVKGLDELAEFLNGLALQKYPATGENDLPIIKIAQLKKGEAEGAGFASRQIGEKYTVHNGDILFSWSGSLEVTRWAGGEGALNQHLFKVSSKDYPHWFIYGWLLEHLPEFQAIAANKATTMGHIQRKHLNDAKATLPPTADLAMMETVMQPIFESVYANDLEAKQLSKLRDELLPRLLSGEIRVTDLVDHQR